MLQLLEVSCVGKCIFESDRSCDCRNGELGITQKFFGLINSEFRDILVDRDSHMLLKQLAEVIFRETDAVADGVDAQIALIMCLDIFECCVYGTVLHRSLLFGVQNILGQNVELQVDLMHYRTGMHLC